MKNKIICLVVCLVMVSVFFTAVSDNLKPYHIIKVISGDTVLVASTACSLNQIAYSGVDAPEPGEYFYQQAMEFNKRLIGDRIWVETGRRKCSSEGRLLGYVYFFNEKKTSTMINFSLIASGYAQAANNELNTEYQQIFSKIEQQAKTLNLGVWQRPQSGLAARCLKSGGKITTAMCCGNTEDFPNTCKIGACGCAPEDSHRIKVCNCGPGKCFNGKKCVAQGSKPSDQEETANLKLAVQNWNLTKQSSGGVIITGTAKNVTDRTIASAIITVKLYNEERARVGTAIDSITFLSSGSTWEFKAGSLTEYSKVNHIKISTRAYFLHQ